MHVHIHSFTTHLLVLNGCLDETGCLPIQTSQFAEAQLNEYAIRVPLTGGTMGSDIPHPFMMLTIISFRCELYQPTPYNS